MPQAVDLVLQNASAVNKTFALINPAAGDNAVANWWLREGAIQGAFPKITILARPTGNQSRKSISKLVLPYSYTDSTTTLTKVGSSAEAAVHVTVPNDFPESLKNDFVAYLQNLCANAVFKACAKDGVAAT